MRSSNFVTTRLLSLKAVAASCALLAAGLAADGVLAQSVAVTHCEGECPSYSSPVAANRSNVVIHHLYAAGINGETSLPDWVAYRLTKDAIGVASLLPRTWQPDRLIRFSALEDIVQTGEDELRLSDNISRSNNPYAGIVAETVEPENRARLAPITSFANTPYWSDLNNFSNMVPMPSPLRLGPWLQLEQQLNRLAAADNELQVIAGPLYLIKILNLSPASTDLNPAAYFKLVSDETGFVAFLFPEDMPQVADYCAQRVSLAEVEEMTELDFYPGRKAMRESRSLLEKLGCQRAG